MKSRNRQRRGQRGVRSETGRLRRAAVRHARDAFGSPERLAKDWEGLGYPRAPDFDAAVRESDAFLALLEGLGVEVVEAGPSASGPDSLYVRDASVILEDGAFLCRMGKAQRTGEPEEAGALYRRLGVRLLGRVEPPGLLEGGDVVWLGPGRVAVGRGYRTNDEGIRQLRSVLEDKGVEVRVVHLPHVGGPAEVFHLMSIFSPVAPDLALVHSPLMPVDFREYLLASGVRLVEAHPEELDRQACNVLAVAPGVVVAAAGTPRTADRLRAAGVEVHLYPGDEISVNGAGGPTCLTRPLERED